MTRLKIIQNKKEHNLEFEAPALLSDILTAHGFFLPHPCGGRGTCKKCTVLLNGAPVLACCTTLTGDSTVILPEPETIATVAGGFESGRLTERVCLCLDIGTTTLVLALVSLDEKCIIRTVTAPNPQRTFGADVISRIDHCSKHGPAELQAVLLTKIDGMIGELLASFELSKVERMYVAGNTTMLHLFFGEDCSSMGVSPYTPVFLEGRRTAAVSLGLCGVDEIVSLPGIAAFVGADIVAGIGYVGAPSSGQYRILVDLGTNAEIALFSEDRILCTAAAAGPCFEGANISCGMSAGEGAICACDENGVCTVMGQEAKGICATGLIDVIAYGVRKELIDETGAVDEDPIPVHGEITLTGRDIREFQLAKSAIRAATECLLKREGIDPSRVDGFYVAGGFSAGLNVKNAAYLGLIPEELAAKFHGINNASLLGAVQYACSNEMLPGLEQAEYVDLSADPLFSELFMEYMMF